MRDPKVDRAMLQRLQGDPAKMAIFATTVMPHYIDEAVKREQALVEIEAIIKRTRAADTDVNE